MRPTTNPARRSFKPPGPARVRGCGRITPCLVRVAAAILVASTLACTPALGSPLVLGLYSVPANACSLAAAAGFTVVHTYEFEVAGKDSTDFVTRARAYLGVAQRRGLRVMLGVPRPWLAQRQEAPVRAAIRALRDHPALFVWYEDEIAEGGDLPAVELLDRVVRAEDPHHSLAIEEAPQIHRLLAIGRARMFTYYPVTALARQAGRLQPLRARFAVDSLRVPFWPVLQAFGRDLIAGFPKPDLVAPRAGELQYTLHSALIAGASGIFYYPYLHPSIFDPAKARAKQWAYGGYKPLPDLAPQLWQDVQSSAADAALLLQLVVGGAPSADFDAAGLPPDVEARAWTTTDGSLVLLANPTYRPRSVRVTTRPEAGSFRSLQGHRWSEPRPFHGHGIEVELPGPGGVALLVQTAP